MVSGREGCQSHAARISARIMVTLSVRSQLLQRVAPDAVRRFVTAPCYIPQR